MRPFLKILPLCIAYLVLFVHGVVPHHHDTEHISGKPEFCAVEKGVSLSQAFAHLHHDSGNGTFIFHHPDNNATPESVDIILKGFFTFFLNALKEDHRIYPEPPAFLYPKEYFCSARALRGPPATC